MIKFLIEKFFWMTVRISISIGLSFVFLVLIISSLSEKKGSAIIGGMKVDPSSIKK